MKNILFPLCFIISLASCKKNNQVVPVVEEEEKKPEYSFVGVAKDPYTGAVSANVPEYLYVKSLIRNDNTFSSYRIFLNRLDNTPYSDTKTVYYNSVVQVDTLRFGTKVTANIVDFRNKVNDEINHSKYVILSVEHRTDSTKIAFAIYKQSTDNSW